MNDWVTRGAKGQFVRTSQIWTPDEWDNGKVDNKGRFRAYRPDCPRAYKNGYAMRAHIVWWLHHGECHPEDTELHHKDHDRLNDDISNLVPLTRSQHRKSHQENWADCVCEHCGKHFQINMWRKTQREREGGKRRFCSRECRNIAPRPERMRRVNLTCQQCGVIFEVIKHRSHAQFCSVQCTGKARRGKPRETKVA